MRYNFDEIIKERLENRYLWRSYLGWLLTHKDLTIYAKREFYKDKPYFIDKKQNAIHDHLHWHVRPLNSKGLEEKYG